MIKNLVLITMIPLILFLIVAIVVDTRISGRIEAKHVMLPVVFSLIAAGMYLFI